MEKRESSSPEPNRKIEPTVLAIIVRWQIREIMKSKRVESVNNMNA